MRNILATILCLVFCASPAVVSAEQQPPWQSPSAWPDRIIATLTAHPATEFSVSWRTSPLETATFAEIVPARSGARFDLGALQVAASSESFSLDPDLLKGSRESDRRGLEIDPVVYHSVKFTGLEADTLYAYRVQGAAGKRSPWRQLRTAPKDGPVEFLYFGDAQNGLRDYVGRVFETAAIVAPEARFMLHTGDLVNSGINDRLWAGWFEAGGRFFSRVPSIPVPGNHDYSKGYGNDGVTREVLTPFWRAQFHLPVEESLPEALHEAVYAIPYTTELHLFAIDSTGPDFEGQMAWLARQFEASDAKWRIIYLHHPYFSWVGVGEEKIEQTRRRKLFDAFLARHDVDLVLSGHRHSYQRAESGPGVHQRDKEKPYQVDTVFLVTASTTQRGTTKVEGWEKWAHERQGNFTLTRWGDYVPIFGVIRTDGDSLSYRGVDAVGQTYDEFRLSKDAKGGKVLHNGPAVFGPVWTQDTAGPYKEWSKHAEGAGLVQ